MSFLRTVHSSGVGIPSKTVWSTTATWNFSKGSLFAAVSFRGGEQAPHEGRRFVGELSQGDFGSSPAEVYQKLMQLKQSLDPDTVFSGAFLWVQGGSAFIVSFDHALVVVQRSGRWRELISGAQKDQVLQGKVQSGDIFALSTASEPVLVLTQSVVADSEMAATLLMPAIQRLENQAEVAVQTILFGEPLVVPDENKNEDSANISRVIPAPSDSSEKVPEQNPVKPEAKYSFSYPQAPTHLISPARLSEGIQSADVVVPKQRGLPKWWRFFRLERKASFPKIKIFRVLAIVLVVFGVFATVLGVRAWRVNTEYTTVVVPLEQSVQEIQAYPEDQRFAQRDAAQSLLERLQATKVSFRTNQREVQTLISQVQTLYNQTAADSSLVNLPVFFDFRLVESTFLATKASIERDQAIFYDPSQNSALKMDLASKRTERVETSAVSGSRDVALAEAQIFWTSPQQVIRTSGTGTDSLTLHTWPADRDPNILERFGTNIYVMDTAVQQLWRFDSQTAASPSAWIRSARGVDLTSITSMTIDGEIWLGSREGDIYRLAQGERREFVPTGLLQPFSSSLLLSSSVEGNVLAVVEPTTQRVVFINKETGEYIRQIRSQQIGAVTDVFWGPGEQSLYLVAGSVVYRVE